MIWAGRPGMWDDWLAFQKQAKEERLARKEKQRQDVPSMKKLALNTLYFLCGLGL